MKITMKTLRVIGATVLLTALMAPTTLTAPVSHAAPADTWASGDPIRASAR